MLPTLGAWYISLLSVSFVAVCLFLMLVILIQRPRGGGLSGAFGGGGGSAQAAFGAKTGDVLTLFTVLCFGAFLLLAMGLTWAIKPPVLTPPDLLGSPNPATTPADDAAPPISDPADSPTDLDTPVVPDSDPAKAPIEEPTQPPAEDPQ